MFDLRRAIADWRKEMLAAGIKSPVLLEELESHLREEIEQQTRDGISVAQAFESAVRNLGQPVILKKEFTKSNHGLILWKLKRLIFGGAATPFLALGDFEPAARQALELAPLEARQLRHDFVGTEHLLLGLMESGSEVVSAVLRNLGLDRQALRLEIERVVPVGPEAVTTAQIPYTPRARQALNLAAKEAHKLNQPGVKPEHILLGLLREGGGVAALVMKKLNVRLDSARAEILKQISGSHGGS
jgi:Clp amino terminal domain, pathogenicity island component